MAELSERALVSRCKGKNCFDSAPGVVWFDS